MKPKKFAQPEQLPKLIATWRQNYTWYESYGGKPTYVTDRLEGYDNGYGDLEELHQKSFLKEVIPEKIKELDDARKVRVLIVGDGLGVFAEQIRTAFPDHVKVFSTGLSKKAIANVRKQIGKTTGFKLTEDGPQMSRNLHPNDLKWRSILQLTDYPEFDIIIDTLGEYLYGHETRLQYLQAVISKLMPGGVASIYPTAKGDEFTEQSILLSKHTNIQWNILPSYRVRGEVQQLVLTIQKSKRS